MKNFRYSYDKITRYALIIMVWAMCMGTAWAGPEFSKGQTLYVPAYSHIYIGHKASPYLLTITLSIRNIDSESSLLLTAVDYYGTEGKLIRQYLTAPVTIPPMASTRYVVPAPDKTGGSGANFIVKWTAMKKINAPIVESIMIGTRSQQGISFTSRGQEIARP
ncbi:MAG: hypothetical protein B6230_05795 [Desulfobacteraceae bacterium 4572_89]|nr:MAG: hypothetical protein B6230_05795 [Desulfobacteraceae bacterium 4572_89]